MPLLRLFEIRELPLVRCVPLNLALSATGEQRHPVSPSDDKEESESQLLSERSQSEKVTAFFLV